MRSFSRRSFLCYLGQGARVIDDPRLLVGIFVVIDGAFIAAGLGKIVNGGWFPFLVAAVLTLVATTWLEGRRCIARALVEQETPVERSLQYLSQHTSGDVPTMVLLSGHPEQVPFFARHRWVRDRAREERVVLLTLTPASVPYIPESDRITLDVIEDKLTRVIAKFGYMELPNIAPIAQACRARGIDLDRDDTLFFCADPKIVPSSVKPFPGWRREWFIALRRIARPLPDDLHIVAERRIELGVTVAI